MSEKALIAGDSDIKTLIRNLEKKGSQTKNVPVGHELASTNGD